MQIQVQIAVMNVRRHSGVHTYSDNLHCAQSLSNTLNSESVKRIES